MSKTTTFNAGMKLAQSGKPLPNLSKLPYTVRQDVQKGFGTGKK